MASENAKDLTVKTGVDSLLNLLKEKKKMSLEEAAKKLNIKQEAIQTWVDFLVEEMVIGIEYHFTKPYIYLNENNSGVEKAKSIQEARKIFIKERVRDKISEERAEFLWKNKLLQEAIKLKPHFNELCKEKKMSNPEFLWEKFMNRLIS